MGKVERTVVAHGVGLVEVVLAACYPGEDRQNQQRAIWLLMEWCQVPARDRKSGQMPFARFVRDFLRRQSLALAARRWEEIVLPEAGGWAS